MLRYCLLSSLLLFCCGLFAQPNSLIIAANTGYTLKETNADPEKTDAMFDEKNGLVQWGKYNASPIGYYVYFRKKGKLTVHARMKGSSVNLVTTCGATSTKRSIPAAKEWTNQTLGKFQVDTTGYQLISLQFAPGTTGVADIAELMLEGEAIENAVINPVARRNAASVHLRYSMPDTLKATSFYNEISVPKGSDPEHSFYMACGFSRGYFGMQVNSPTERRIIFSVWDAGNEAVDRNKVADENKVKLLAKGLDVVTNDFGNEGTGGHSHLVYNWKADSTYKFMVVALPDSASNSTIYSGYFFVPEAGKWKLIASFRAPKDGQYITKPYAFVENFWGSNGHLQRKAFFTNTSFRGVQGNWLGTTSATFTTDATGKAGHRLDFGGGPADNGFNLWTGGFKKADAKAGEVFLKKGNVFAPEADVNRNADSLKQAAIDQQLVLKAIAAKQYDTTGRKDGVWYKIIEPGSGRKVEVSDTVTVFYKGYLLNGEVFDQTKEKPARFPLNRLIRGWQVGLPLLAKGGKIQLIIPSGIGYGIRTRSAKIPPNSILVFEVEVVDAEAPKTNIP